VIDRAALRSKLMTQPIGVFDSGIGGLSILEALRSHLPHERFVYFADSAHNPYGEKSEAFVQQRTLFIARELVAQHQIKALVVACNTATAAAIALLREAYPELPIIGVEPALKPAAMATRTGQVLVLATRGTLQSAKFAQLKARVEAEHQAAGRSVTFACVPCDGLAERIEKLAESALRWQNTPDLIALCAYSIRARGQFGIKNEAFDTLVLGCTHYPLIRETFASLLGSQVQIVDNALPVALRTEQLLQAAKTLAEDAPKPIQTPAQLLMPQVLWQSSAQGDALQRAARYWLGEASNGANGQASRDFAAP
jgi:glutamate racemase